jgi:hypothetical protein
VGATQPGGAARRRSQAARHACLCVPPAAETQPPTHHATQVEGIPATSLSKAAQDAREAGHAGASAEAGPWLFTLDSPSYV